MTARIMEQQAFYESKLNYEMATRPGAAKQMKANKLTVVVDHQDGLMVLSWE